MLFRRKASSRGPLRKLDRESREGETERVVPSV